jgi:hypothetical protein
MATNLDTRNSNADVRGLDHTQVIGTISDGKEGVLWSALEFFFTSLASRAF